DRRMMRMGPFIVEMIDGPRGVGIGENFRMAMNDALVYAGLAAFAAGGIASLLLSRRLMAPVKSMMQASQRIAEGDYSKRVPTSAGLSASNQDELDQLAHSFNRMAEKLEQIELMRRQLIADVSHELRTPLTAIKGSMEGLIDGVLPADHSTYQSVYREADRLQRLVEDLQELSRVESGGIELTLKPVNLRVLIKNAVQRMRPTFDEKKVELESDIQEKLPRVKADEDRLLQVIINLLSNALQFTPKKGSVKITAAKIKNDLVVSIADNGMGIKPQDMEHIFERFYRADKSRSRQEGGGSGIGLTIAQSLVRAHGGRIWVESKGEGKGSNFYFSLPINRKN
ncbi:MAG: HAMP domain-containing sensor histidine kinase, partial [Saprospiraceae bacterium]|nr:HAMP domain-containing sensor histidine kinase [Saprospiraceae bacterium]